MTRFFALALAALSLTPAALAQRFEYPPEEFVERRQAVCEAIEEPATVILFSATRVPVGIRFRQDNDFFYLTGNEDMNAAVVDRHGERASRGSSWSRQTEREASRDGWNWLYEEGAAESTGASRRSGR